MPHFDPTHSYWRGTMPGDRADETDSQADRGLDQPAQRATRYQFVLVAKVLRNGRAPCIQSGGGRTWWAHFEYTRIDIDAPTVPYKKGEPPIRGEGAQRPSQTNGASAP